MISNLINSVSSILDVFIDLLLGNFVNLLLIAVTIGVAIFQYRANNAPMLSVIEVAHKLPHDDHGYYKVIVKNRGNGIALDALLFVKEIKEEKEIGGVKTKNQYYISKPTREIGDGSERELYIYKEINDLNVKEVRFFVVYIDFFGRKYLASDVFKGELRNKYGRDNKHMERFTKRAKQLPFWSLTKYKYIFWRRMAIYQRNTMLGYKEKQEEREKERRRKSSLFNTFFLD